MTMTIFAVLLGLCGVLNGRKQDNDMTRISYSFNGKTWFTRAFGDVDYINFTTPYDSAYINCDDIDDCVNQRDLYFECTYGTNIWLRLGFISGCQKAEIPYRLSCDSHVNNRDVYNLKATPNVSEVQLTWDNNDSADEFIIYYMGGMVSEYRHTSQNSSYLLTNLRARTSYQICVATIYKSRLGPYRCVRQTTDFAEYGPVRYIDITFADDYTNIYWLIPPGMLRNPNGYIITYSGSLGEDCRTIILNMDNSSIDHFNACPNKTNILQMYDDEIMRMLTIYLKPYTTYNISIKAVLIPKQSKYQTTTVTTYYRRREHKAIRASLHNNTLRIDFDRPINTSGVIVSYHVRIERYTTRECNTTWETLVSARNITVNHFNLPLTSADKCTIFDIEVTPSRGWRRHDGHSDDYNILFQNNPSHFKNIQAWFLTSNIIQISWVHDGCDDVAYMIEVTDIHNPSDCTTRLLSLYNCSDLNYMRFIESVCKNKKADKLLNNGPIVVVNISGSYSYINEYQVIILMQKGYILELVAQLSIKQPIAKIKDVEARILSSDLIEIWWTNDGFSDVTYMIEVSDKHNISDCTIRLSSLEHCSLLKDMMTNEFVCPNMGSMTLLNIRASVIVNITGSFTYMRDYRIRIWKILKSVTLVAQISIKRHPDITEVYDQYIRFSKLKLNIFWSLNTSNDGSIREYILRFRNSYLECLGSTHLICMQGNQYNNYNRLSHSKQIKKDYLLNCPSKESFISLQDKDTYYGNLKIDTNSTNFFVDIYAVTAVDIYDIYTRSTIYKPIINPNITEVFYHIDTSRRHFMFFWRYDIKSGVFVFNFIIRVSTQSHKCVQSINYVCDSCYGINTNTSLSRQQISDWDNLLICRQQSTEVFTQHTAFFSGSISSPESLDNVVLSIYGLSSLGIHNLY